MNRSQNLLENFSIINSGSVSSQELSFIESLKQTANIYITRSNIKSVIINI